MRCLTDSEVSEWLRQHAVPEQPSSSNRAPDYYLQFHAPPRHRRLDALARQYYDRIIPGSSTLVHMTDWGLYTASDMIAVAGIRVSHGEERPLIEAPGHAIESDEAEVGIALFALAASFEWSAYLYSSQAHTTLYNWEGEIFDFWTDSAEVLSAMRMILGDFALAETGQAEQSSPAYPEGRADASSGSAET